MWGDHPRPLAGLPQRFLEAPGEAFREVTVLIAKNFVCPLPQCGRDLLGKSTVLRLLSLSPQLPGVIASPNQSSWVTTQVRPSQSPRRILFPGATSEK